MSDGFVLSLDAETAIELLVLLTQHESAIDARLEALREEIERRLYEVLSVEEMEQVMRRAESGRGA